MGGGQKLWEWGLGCADAGRNGDANATIDCDEQLQNTGLEWGQVREITGVPSV
jgi:hypothetical protein